MGHTPTGKENHPAPKAGLGPECDKLNAKAMDVMFNGLMAKLIADAGPLAGKTLVSTHIDSWEIGSQNWTPRFREEFRRLRGYDPLPFLPVMTGRVVDNLELSERFLVGFAPDNFRPDAGQLCRPSSGTGASARLAPLHRGL